MRSKPLGLVFDVDGTFDLQSLRDRQDLDVRHCSTLSSCPDLVSFVIAVESARSPGDSWRALHDLQRRYPCAPMYMASRASGQWLLSAASIRPLGALSDPQTVRALAGSTGGEGAAIDMVGDHPLLARTREVIARVAPSDVHVLITGESGTGKELVAELVHRASGRRRGPFVALNCAAIPDSLVESELFGYQKGAFTGAVAARDGRFAEAHGGTLFLDEIGELTHYAQAKILRAVETGRIDRLGTRAADVDVRCVAATNRNLEEMVSAGTFRQDLYFRLNVVEIRLPPLRYRGEDIPALLSHYIAQFNRRFSTVVTGIDDQLLEVLKAYTWPGNIRELRNMLESIYAHRPPAVVSMADLPDALRRRLDATRSDEKQRLLATLRSSNWNKSAAARELRWSRVTLYRKLTQYDVSTPPLKAHLKSDRSRHAG